MMMATVAAKCLCLSFLSLLTICSSGTPVGLSGNAGGKIEASSSVSSRSQNVKKEQDLQIFPSTRKLSSSLRTTLHDNTIFPTTPVATPGLGVTLPPDNPTPIVTVPATNPVTVTPSTPVPIPATTPVTVPPTNPEANTPAPITNPVTTPAPVTVPGAQPITNPVTTYPAPAGNNVPFTTPVTNPVAPPATTTNAPAVPGQSWCAAKTGVSQLALQQALDYACGIGGADCSQIQQGGSCYNPNSVQNHASYAFNSYYQKNPVPTSCDFGGTAAIVSTNPSTGSCIFPSSASSSAPSLPTPSTSSTNPATTTPTYPATTTPNPTAGPGDSSAVTPPSVLNSSTNPGSASTTGFGSDAPPGVSTSTSSRSSILQLFIGSAILVTSFVTGIFTM